ncbi:toxin TcdB middle/N-terminal domain-containing protein, partial [Flavobacterium sp.]|uniref:toxin TcdB middle/N-terminal domain-containing protein n=1 Tax=Flavobacterium sp. TaxID=239 RepID=UPI00391CB93C
VLPNVNVLSSLPSLGSNDFGVFNFLVKKNGKIIGKRKVGINAGVIVLDNATPIVFHQGLVDVNNPPRITCEYYLSKKDGPNNLTVFQKFTHDVVNNVIVGNSDEWSNYSTADLNHFHRFRVYSNTDYYGHLGSMNHNWGQFLYNDSADSSNNPQDNYSKLINDDIVDDPFSSLTGSTGTVFGFDTSQCNQPGMTNQEINDCYQNGIMSSLGIPSQGSSINQSNITSVVNTILANQNLNTSGLLNALALVPMSANRSIQNQQLNEKWIGFYDSQFTSQRSMRDGDLAESTLGSVFVDPTDVDSPELAPNQFTGMYAINKLQKSKAYSYQAGYGPVMFSYSDSKYSNNDSDFVDVNGDRYPDIISSNNIQHTRMTGGHRPPVANTQLNPINANDSRNLAFSRRGTTPVAGRMELKQSESDNGRPNYSMGTGINVNLDGETKEKAFFTDINGDGLVDRIFEHNGAYVCALNMGSNFNSQQPITYNLLDVNTTKPSTVGVNASIAMSGLVSGMPFSLSGGFSAAGGNTKVALQDINGDALPDLIFSNNVETKVRYNLGNKFSNTLETLTYPISQFNNNVNTSISLSGSFFPFVGHKLVFFILIITPFFFFFFPIWYLKYGAKIDLSANLTVSEAKKQIQDFNGDGYPDFVEKDGTNLKVYHSRIKRTNMLKKVTNPLKGNFILDYTVQKNDYNSPHSKWTLSSVIVNDNLNLVNDGIDSYIVNYTYENGKYDRREREFLGFEHVIEQKNDVNAGINHTVKSTYYNNSYFLSGLLKEQVVYASNQTNSILSKTTNFYQIFGKNNDNTEINFSSPQNNNYDVGGTEGRRSGIVLLNKIRNENYELTGSPQIISEILFEYDTKGRVRKYTNKGDLATSADDYYTNISYHSVPSLNIISIPRRISVNGNSGAVYRSRVSEIDPANGNILEVNAYNNGGVVATTSMEYDQFGNLVQIQGPENSNQQRMFYKYTYDTAYQKYIEQIDDAFGYISHSSYNPYIDKVNETIDKAGNSMRYDYDRFGRLSVVLAPKEIQSGARYTIAFEYYPRYSLLPTTATNVTATNFVPVALTKHFDVQHPNNDIETYTFVDGLGRAVQVKKDIWYDFNQSPSSPNFKEALTVSGQQMFDGYGRTTKSFKPTVEEKLVGSKFLINNFNTSIAESTTVYDSFDRPIKVFDANSNITVFEYGIDNDNFGNLATYVLTDVDQDGSQHVVSKSFTDCNGRQLSNSVVGPNGLIWTKFDFDEIGQLVQYMDDEGLVTKYTYDNFGRKIQVDNPDRGTTLYKYDNVNLLSIQTSNLINSGTSVNYEYFYTRLTDIKFPENPDGSPNIANVHYEYGNSGNETGRVVAQIDATGFQRFGYGNMGELTFNLRNIVGPNIPMRQFSTFYTYDSWNRLLELDYPDGERLFYNYDLGGNVTAIFGDINGTPTNYVKRVDYDYYEQKTYMQFGNGTETYYTYNNIDRKLDNLKVKTSNGNDLYNNRYSYDFIGNIKSIHNTAPSTSNDMAGYFSHNFKYDVLNRLTIASGNFTGSNNQLALGNDASSSYDLTMDYNTTHGITSKIQNHVKNGSIAGDNTYSNNYEYYTGTHRLKNINDPNTSISEDYDYDSNGNIIKISNSQGFGKRLYWDEADRLRVLQNDRGMQHYI